MSALSLTPNLAWAQHIDIGPGGIRVTPDRHEPPRRRVIEGHHEEEVSHCTVRTERVGTNATITG